MGIRNVEQYVARWNIPGGGQLIGMLREFARPDEPPSPEPTLQPGDFIKVIDIHSARSGEYGRIVGRAKGGPFQPMWVVEFARYDPDGRDGDGLTKQGHGWIMLENQLSKEQ